ncbi:MAG: ABC transporter permease [Pseudomonadota bacterium]|nr:ABC transporter permease [Pseudomonadota bacterium]
MAFIHVATPYTMAVVRRQYIVWLKLIWSSLAINIANPILFLFAFGFGLGRFIDTIGGVSYLVYVVPGMVAYSAMFAASFETTIGSFSRFYMLRTWDATLATPVTLSELLFGEVLWASLKAMLAAVSVLIVGWLWGGIPEFTGGLIALPIIFVASVGFACYGLLATSLARGYEFFAYFFTFWVTPMFIFSGVFFEIEVFPLPVQIIAWALPMTHLVAIIRPLTAGLPLDLGMVAVHLGYTMLLSVIAFTFAYRRMRKRMFD